MKKFFIIFSLLFLSACQKEIREDYYVVNYGSLNVAPGFDAVEVVNGNKDIASYNTFITDKEEEILCYIEIYLDETKGSVPMIGDYTLSKGIKEACSDLNGELIDKNGIACYIGKRVNNRENYVILHGDILDDDINKIDRIEIGYDAETIE